MCLKQSFSHCNWVCIVVSCFLAVLNTKRVSEIYDSGHVTALLNYPPKAT